MEIPGSGGYDKQPWNENSRGVGILNKRALCGGGVWIFLELHVCSLPIVIQNIFHLRSV